MLYKEFLVELAKKLTAPLAFSVIFFLVGIIFRKEIPVAYQPVPFLIGITGIVVYTILSFFQIRRKYTTRTGGKIQSSLLEKSAVATQNRGILLQIVNNYANNVSQPNLNKQAMANQLAEYLDWVEEVFSTIVLRGIEQEGRQVVTLPLENIYVPLCAEINMEEFRDVGQLGRQKDLGGLLEMTTGITERNIVLLNQALKIGPRLIITGDPGSGKSTVLQHLAWTLAVSNKSGLDALAKERLGLSVQYALPLPIYIPLSLYASYLRYLPKDSEGRKRTLAYFISDYLLKRQTNLNINPDFLAYLLREENHVLLLLDGLDEIPTDAERIQVRQAIEDLVAGRDTLRVVVTSRTASYHGQAKLGRGFRQLRILPLEFEQIKSLIQQAYSAIYVKSRRLATKKADELISSILILEEARRQRLGSSIEPLVTTPLMVRLFLIVTFNNRILPAQRADLYQKAVDAMLRPDYALDEYVATEIEKRIGGSLAMNRDMLQHIAFFMHSKGEISGHAIEENALSLILQMEPTYRPFIQELIYQTRQRNTLLEEINGMYSFIHLSFQEFLVGRYLAQNKDIEEIADLLESGLVLISWWREPILLLVGYLDINSPVQARRLLFRLARLSGNIDNKPLSYEIELSITEMAASAYLECQNQADDLRTQFQQRIKSLLEREDVLKIKPIFRASRANILDQLGYTPSDLNSFIPVVKSNPQKYLISKYLITNMQYARFLTAKDFSSRDYWVGFPMFDENGNDLHEDSGDNGWNWFSEELQNRNNNVEEGVLYPSYWTDPRFGNSRRCAPVVGISWWEANAYCRWLLTHWDEEIGLNQPRLIRLPIEKEWISASGGEKNDRYAWDKDKSTSSGTELSKLSNTAESGIGSTTIVWMYPHGKSHPLGLFDICGNVWEWQANFYNLDHDDIALRGGAWNDNQISARISYRFLATPSTRSLDTGFRIVIIPDD